jgi:hypothetical protein
MVKFASNQFFVISYLKCFHSSFAIFVEFIITKSHFSKRLCTTLEVDLDYDVFPLMNDAFDLGDFLCWVEDMALFEIIWSYLAKLAVRKGESNCPPRIPINFF